MKRLYLALTGVMILCAGSAWFALEKMNIKDDDNIVSINNYDMGDGMMTVDENIDTASVPTESRDLLLYLIEEEKLAHDVYTKLYDLYGNKVFGNILKSESTHQSRVKTLLDARDIADPRSKDLGVFTNPDLQKLYDELIAKGSLSEQDAYEVGVAIEEKDIQDISSMLAKISDTDIVSALESLRSGSENHLRAFNKQLGRTY